MLCSRLGPMERWPKAGFQKPSVWDPPGPLGILQDPQGVSSVSRPRKVGLRTLPVRRLPGAPQELGVRARVRMIPKTCPLCAQPVRHEGLTCRHAVDAVLTLLLTHWGWVPVSRRGGGDVAAS